MNPTTPPNFAELESKLPYIKSAPKNNGELKMIVVRPSVDERNQLTEGQITKGQGLVGDNWSKKSDFPKGPPNPEKQLTLMNSRCIEVIANSNEDWPMAGDQLFVDFDLSEVNIPAGTQLKIGNEVVVKVSAIPHNGCKKFAARFGTDSVKFVNSKLGKSLHLRGINAQVMKEGTVKVGDQITKLDS